jgi:hypothetical protein
MAGKSEIRRYLGSSNGIADVPHGLNQGRLANSFAQASDENLHEFGIVFVGMFPNAFAQLRAGKYSAGLAHEDLEQHELAG